MGKTKNLIVLSETEKYAFYGLPDFNDQQRREYFSFSPAELALIKSNHYAKHKVICALQLGYFKAKQLFFTIDIRDERVKQDIAFIIFHYIPEANPNKISITSHTYYAQRQQIAAYMGYTLWNTTFLPMLYEHAAQIIQRDIAPNFLARELLSLLAKQKIVRPGYSTLQIIVSESLAKERHRISGILSSEINQELKEGLDTLMRYEDGIVKLAALKQDARNFGFKMMLKERQKYNTLAKFYPIATDIIHKLGISKQNIEHYAELAIYYNPYDLANLKNNQSYLYLLCYITKRYHQLTDNLVEAFIYHYKKFNHSIAEKAKVATNSLHSKSAKIGRLLLYYVDEKFDDADPFLAVRKRAFKTMPKDEINVLGNTLMNRSKYKKELYWREVDKGARVYKKNLRPLFTTLKFSSEDECNPNPWMTAVNLLQTAYSEQTKLSDLRLSDFPSDTIPNLLRRYLVEKTKEGEEKINIGRYEYWLYKQLNKQISEGKIYFEKSVHHGCFKHELIPLSKVTELQLKVPWLQSLPDQQTEYLCHKLDTLWQRFNKQLTQGKLPHLRYNTTTQKIRLRKIKAENNHDAQKQFYARLPICDINEVIRFVDEKCHFLSMFTPLQPRYAKEGQNNLDRLIAAILSQAFSYGSHKMAQASDISYKMLETTTEQYLRLATLRAANDTISKAASKLSIYPYYALDMELIYSSLDGQKFELMVPNIKARHSKKHLREGQGVSAYTMLANNIPLHSIIIGSNEHESYYLFDIWKNNTSGIIPQLLTGDMHIVNKANFAIMHWFGAGLQARFTTSNLQPKYLYCGKEISKYKNYLIRPAAQIDIQIINDQKSAIDQLVATLELKEMNQATLIKKLCHLPSENKLRKAVFEYDKLIRSIYALEYLMSVNLQRTVNHSQTRIEAYHQLRAAIARVGGKKQLYGKTDIEVEISNQCAVLVANTIIYYNSVILSALLDKYQSANNFKKIPSILNKISPIAWQHIHLLGQYTFQNKQHNIDINKLLAKLQFDF